MAKTKTAVSRVPLRCGQFFVYLLYRCVERVIHGVPLALCWRWGSWLGLGAYYALPAYARLAERNLAIAFADEMDARAIRALARRHFAALGRNFICSIKVTGMPLEELAARVSYEGLDETETRIPDGVGAIAALCHLGTWEILSQVPMMKKKRKGSMLYQRLQNPFMDAHVLRRRSRAGLQAFDRREGFYGPMTLLGEGGGLGILVDQHAGDKGVWCPLFGRLASTTNIAALFSVRSGCPIIPVAVYPDGVGRWKLAYGDPVTLRGAIPRGADAAGALTAEMNVVLEKMIRRAPEEWFWVHNRWKTPNPNFLLARYKRGVEFPMIFDPAKSLKPFNVLVRSPNWLGDACMAVPAVRAIKRGRPDLRLSVLAPENLAELWSRVEEVDAVLAKRESDSPWQVGNGLRARRFDAGVLLPNSLRAALEMKAAKIPRIVGFRGHHRRLLLGQVVADREKPGPTEHQADVYLRLAAAIGADPAHIAQEKARARNSLAHAASRGGPGPLRLGLCAGAQYGKAKQWPLDRFAAAAEKVRVHTGCEWVLFGGPGEGEDGQKLARMLGGQCLNLVGKTNMAELMKQLGECRLLLTNDTGAMHLADFLGVPTVAVFGSTDPAKTGPLGDGHRVVRHHVECSPCFLRECPLDFRCMLEIDPAEVARAVVEMLGAKPGAGVPHASREAPK